MGYLFKEIEDKWQQIWNSGNVYEASPDTSKPKYYILIEFPYPSGEGLHVGHPRSYVGLDVVARKRRMEGYNVLFPIGWDAFGLPAENYAIKTGVHPRESTNQNIGNFKRQLRMLGLSFDWSREINTTDPDYYKWTQWIFLRFFEKGLAYKAEIPINWCPSCKVGLANEEVIGNNCERCGARVERRRKSQWMLRITKYADRLIEDLETVDYLPRIKSEQINWIGKSCGAEINFAVPAVAGKIMVFTSRPDTLFGATYLVLSPEHGFVEEVISRIDNPDEVRRYQEKTASKSELERTSLTKEKTGVELTGVTAVNPVTGESLPIWISDYVLVSYGTGAIMAVPAHDTRDYEFANEFGLPIKEVIAGGDVEKEAYVSKEGGTLVNSSFLNGMSVLDAIETMINWLEKEGIGGRKINYKLRDWVFSRQRYWGEPIPLICCDKCGWVPVPKSQLPLVLPEVKNFVPSEEGESLLATLSEWVNTSCPRCGGQSKRETDTMPQWAGSSWYFLRYTDPRNSDTFASKGSLDYWVPVDWYNGGMEHTTLHLLYSRFWHKFLYDEGLVPSAEPYKKRTSHGMILGADGEKMSKSRGNVVNPDSIVRDFGADAFRTYEMFMGAFDQTAPWSMEGVVGVSRFLNRVWSTMEKMHGKTEMTAECVRLLHRTVKRVGDRIESMKFNTAIAEIMSYTNELLAMADIPNRMIEVLCLLLHPFAPHITSEIWEKVINDAEMLCYQPWPVYDPELARNELVTVAVQVNGKLRCTLDIEAGLKQDEILLVAKRVAGIQKYIDEKPVKKIIFVPDRILNIVL